MFNTSTKNIKAAYVLLADGFETVEALTIVDILRRADYPVYTVSVTGRREVSSAQNIPVVADLQWAGMPTAEDVGLVFIPGGLPGATTLRDDARVIELLQAVDAAGNIVASICAGPLALERAGLSQKHRGTCFPGFEEKVRYQTHEDAVFVTDGNLSTSRGPATAIYLGLELLRRLTDKATADRVKADMQLTYLENKLN